MGSRNAATPVIVRRGALADNVPNRDLYLTKGHSLHLNGSLIPVEFLVNHRSIVWDDRAQEVEIYHIEPHPGSPSGNLNLFHPYSVSLLFQHLIEEADNMGSNRLAGHAEPAYLVG